MSAGLFPTAVCSKTGIEESGSVFARHTRTVTQATYNSYIPCLYVEGLV